MPNYDFECSQGHQFEKYVPLSEWKDKMRIECEQEGCTAEAHQVVLPRGAGTTIEPFVYYLRSDGKIEVPGVSNLPTPKGYTRCEATTIGEMRQLEKRLGREERAELARHRELSDAIDEQETNERRRELRHAMERMSNAGRDFARYAMEQGNRKRNFRSHDLGYHFSILHNDERHRREEG